MFIDANHVKKDSVIESDICIIGAGAAGITLGLSFMNSSFNVVIIESGDLNKGVKIQKLNETETTNLPIGNPNRARRFGGTTTLWVGRWKPHDKIDFEKRDWVVNSGWPISLFDLEPYYQKSATLLDAPNYSNFSLNSPDLNNQHIIDSNNIETSVFRCLEKKDFDWGKKYQDEFSSSETVKIG